MASEIRVDKINSLSGVGTVTLSPTGVDIAGITTAATLRATTGIVTSLTAVSSAKVGSGVTLSPDGDIFATGVTTSTTFVGNLTGNVTGNVSGSSGSATGNAGGLTGTPNISCGTIAGSTGTFTGDVDIADKIVHTGDTNTAIRFPADDTISLETGGQDRLLIASDGRITQKTGDLVIDQSNNGYGGLRILDSTAGEYSINYIAGRNSGATAHVFSISGRTQGSSPWANATQSECARISQRGISFNGDDAQANALDDYEEGSWTPSLTSTSTDPTISSYSIQHGRYTKIGNVVHIFCFLDIAAGNIGGTLTGDGQISGLPYTISNTPSQTDVHGSACDNLKSIPNSFSSQRDNAMIYFPPNVNYVALHQYAATNPIYQTGWGMSQIGNGNRFKWAWTGQYRTDS